MRIKIHHHPLSPIINLYHLMIITLVDFFIVSIIWGLSSAPANPLSSTLLRSWLILAQFFASVFNIFHISYKSFFIFFVLILNFCFLVLSLLVPVAVVRFKLFCIFFSLLVEKLELDLNFSCSLLPFPDSKSSHRMAGPRPVISTHPRNPQDV